MNYVFRNSLQMHTLKVRGHLPQVGYGPAEKGVVMRYSTHLVSIKVIGMAFAILLAPMIMGQDSMDCTGDTSLAVLEFKPFQMPGQELPDDLLGFEPSKLVYRLDLPDSVERGFLVAEPTDPTSLVVVHCYVGAEEVGLHVMDPATGWFVIELPEGDSTVRVTVSATGGAEGWYAIDVFRCGTAAECGLI